MCQSGHKMLRHLSHFKCTARVPRIPDMGQKGGGWWKGGTLRGHWKGGHGGDMANP